MTCLVLCTTCQRKELGKKKQDKGGEVMARACMNWQMSMGPVASKFSANPI